MLETFIITVRKEKQYKTDFHGYLGSLHAYIVAMVVGPVLTL